jgi:hypothetical protein
MGRTAYDITQLESPEAAFKYAATMIAMEQEKPGGMCLKVETELASKAFMGANRYKAGQILKTVAVEQANRERLAAERKCCEAKSNSEDRCQRIVGVGMHKFDHLVDAQARLGTDLWSVTGDMRIFVIDVQKRMNEQNGVKKNYVKSSVAKAYSYAMDRVKSGVMMHEVINADLPCCFHLDVEPNANSSKFEDTCTVNGEMKHCYEEAVEEMLMLFGVKDVLEIDDEAVKALAAQIVLEYGNACREEQTIAKGEVGAEVMMEFVGGHLEEQIAEIKERGVKL